MELGTRTATLAGGEGAWKRGAWEESGQRRGSLHCCLLGGETPGSARGAGAGMGCGETGLVLRFLLPPPLGSRVFPPQETRGMNMDAAPHCDHKGTAQLFAI